MNDNMMDSSVSLYEDTGKFAPVQASTQMAGNAQDYDAPEYRTKFQYEDTIQNEVTQATYADDSPTIFLAPEFIPFVTREGNGEKITFETPAVLGKGSAASCLISGNPAISRKHVQIDKRDDDFIITDLQSTNGTWVNNMRLAPGAERMLREGDVIMMANENLTFGVMEEE